MRIVFMGTPDFAVPCLKMLIEEHEVVGVFTQPDRPKGRGKKMLPPPIKVVAEESNIPVYQPEKIKKSNVMEILNTLSPELIIVIAYGQILSKEILDFPKHGCVNVHASLLPKYRGAAPINWSIVNGESETGITTMYMDVGLDTGDMIVKDKVVITETTIYGELHDELMELGMKTLKNTIKLIEEGNTVREKQNDMLSSYAPMLDKTTAIIDWRKTASEIDCHIRGFNPWPVAITKYEDEKMKIFKAVVLDEKSTGKPGEIMSVDKDGIQVSTGENLLLVEEIQFPNKKRMAVEQFILGNDIKIGVVLG